MNVSLNSSSGQFSYIPFATLAVVSSPTISLVLKVADLGLPIIGPVKLSISSILKPNFSTLLRIFTIAKVPILLPINPGVSFAKTKSLPRNLSPKSFKKSIISGLQSGPGITSKSFKYLGGLKK